MAIIGIDLGTTNSLVAVYRDGQSELLPNEFGEYLTPSVVHVTKDREVIVGKTAREYLITDPENTASVFKRSMGMDRVYYLRGMAYRPEDLSAFVIRKLVEDAKRVLQEEIEEAIISVPAYFDDVRRKATKRAGEIAGVHVERLINEPSAAALACRMAEGDGDQVYLVFDYGGGTLDISVVDCFDNVISVNAVSGDNHLGGSDFDRVIAEYICEQLGAAFQGLSQYDQSVVLRRAEQLKILLSSDKEAEIPVQLETISGSVSLTHDKLIEISNKIFNRIRRPIRQVLNDCDFGMNDIDKIVLVGGSSKMTVVNMYLYYLLGRELSTVGNPDEMVARGLGYYAGMKERKQELEDLVLTDICPFSLGVEVNNETDSRNPYFAPIIERNSVLPISRVRQFVTSSNYQRAVLLNIYQGDEQYAKDNLLLASMEVPVKPMKAGEEGIDVRFTYDINGILDVDVAVLSSGAVYQKTIVNKKLKLSSEMVKKQLEEMKRLKRNLRKQPENQYVVQKAGALYRQTRGQAREYIAGVMEYFDRVLAEADENKVRHVRKRVLVLLSQMEAGLNDEIFDEIQWEEDYEGEMNFLEEMRSRDEAGEKMNGGEAWENGSLSGETAGVPETLETGESDDPDMPEAGADTDFTKAPGNRNETDDEVKW